MRFSIIIPAYNAEKYLPECLASVYKQTFNDYEVIAVDDGSSDCTAQILDKYAAVDERVVVLHGSNQGLLLARRRGLSCAKAEYVLFLDADDCLRKDALEVISKTIDDSGADIVSFQYSRDESFSSPARSLEIMNLGMYQGESYVEVKKHVCNGRFNNLWGKAIRLCRIDIDTVYEPYKGLMHGEDLFQLLPIIDHCSSLCQIPDILYFYRPNDGSSTAFYKPSQLADIVLVNRRLFEFADKWGGDCVSAALLGESNQYLYLFKISELSQGDKISRLDAFSEITNTIEREGLFKCLRHVHLRADNRLLLFCMEHHLYSIACFIVKSVELLKHF